MSSIHAAGPAASAPPPDPGRGAAPAWLGEDAEAIAEALAQASGRSAEEILALRASGNGFGRIAKALGVSFGEVGRGRSATPPEPAAGSRPGEVTRPAPE